MHANFPCRNRAEAVLRPNHTCPCITHNSYRYFLPRIFRQCIGGWGWRGQDLPNSWQSLTALFFRNSSAPAAGPKPVMERPTMLCVKFHRHEVKTEKARDLRAWCWALLSWWSRMVFSGTTWKQSSNTHRLKGEQLTPLTQNVIYSQTEGTGNKLCYKRWCKTQCFTHERKRWETNIILWLLFPNTIMTERKDITAYTLLYDDP